MLCPTGGHRTLGCRLEVLADGVLAGSAERGTTQAGIARTDHASVRPRVEPCLALARIATACRSRVVSDTRRSVTGYTAGSTIASCRSGDSRHPARTGAT